MSVCQYVTYRQIEDILERSFLEHRPLDILSLYPLLQDCASGHPLPLPPANPAWGSCSDEDFREKMDAIPLVLQEPVITKGKNTVGHISEQIAFGIQSNYFNLMMHRQYNFLLEQDHAHDYIEMYYVFSGACSIHVGGQAVQLQKGDYIILAPGCSHHIDSHRKENFILDLSVRGSSFENLFRQQLSYTSVLSSFYRKIIYDHADLNYILFHTRGDEEIKMALKNIAMETNLHDTYNEILYISWANIIFSLLLRKYYEDVETDPPLENNDFSRVLKYISDHYDTVTLDDLSERFHYSKPHICNMIKENTGRTLTALVNAQKLTHAEMLLETTDFSMEEIAELIGFSSVDYFIRLFHRTYGITPGKFRKSRQQNSSK